MKGNFGFRILDFGCSGSRRDFRSAPDVPGWPQKGTKGAEQQSRNQKYFTACTDETDFEQKLTKRTKKNV
jgi:hypothetical protein